MANIDFVIEEELAVISVAKNGWSLELNLVSWNGRPAKYDIRQWSPDHEKMGKGLTFSKDELKALYEVLGKEVELL